MYSDHLQVITVSEKPCWKAFTNNTDNYNDKSGVSDANEANIRHKKMPLSAGKI